MYNAALALYRDQQMQHAIANFVGAVQRFEALPDGWNNLAIIAQALGFMDSATKYAALALIYSPSESLAFLRSFASCHVNRFITQSDPEDREIALVYLARALKLSPKPEKEIVEAYTALLMNGQDHRRCIAALQSIAPLFESAPNNIQAMRLASLAICYRDAHEGALAVQFFEKAIELAPNESSYHYELGGMFKRSEFPTLLDVNRALLHVQRSLELAPNSAVVTYSLASIYAISRQLDQAIELFERAYRLDSTLDVALVEAFQLKQSVCNWKDRDMLTKRIIALTKRQLSKPVPAAAQGVGAPHLTPWYCLSMRLPRGMQLALARRHAHVEAMRAPEFVPAAAAAAQAEAKVNKEMFDRQEREEAIASGEVPPPPPPRTSSSIVASKGRSGTSQRKGGAAGSGSGSSGSNGGGGGSSSSSSHANNTCLNSDCSRWTGPVEDDYDDVYDDDNDYAPPAAVEVTPFADDEAVWTPMMLDVVLGSSRWRREPLRVGLLSSDLSDSNVGQSLIGWLRDPDLEDGGRVKLLLYSMTDSDGSTFRREMCGADDSRCINVGSLSLNKLNDRIRADRIDVLINMNGFTKFSRNELMPLRPAPVRVNYKGFPGTMGAYHDYIIGDPILTPLEHRDLYSERIVQLPHSFFLTSYPDNYGHAMFDLNRTEHSKSALGLQLPKEENETFVFCNFNHLYKVTPDVFDVWMRLLAAIPNSIFWFVQLPDAAEKNLKREAKKRDIDPARIYVAPIYPLMAHLVVKANCDLFLDTLIFNAHGTATDALWAGIPLLTVIGETMQSRAAASHLHNLGVPELIVTSLIDYEATALALATEHYNARNAARLDGRDSKVCRPDHTCARVPLASKLYELRERIMQARMTSHLFCARRWWADMRFALTMMRAVERNRLGNRHIVVPSDPARYAKIAAITDYFERNPTKLYAPHLKSTDEQTAKESITNV